MNAHIYPGSKRPRAEMAVCFDYPTIAAKKPRKLISPSSAAISIVSPENDVAAIPHFCPMPQSSSTAVLPSELIHPHQVAPDDHDHSNDHYVSYVPNQLPPVANSYATSSSAPYPPPQVAPSNPQPAHPLPVHTTHDQLYVNEADQYVYYPPLHSHSVRGPDSSGATYAPKRSPSLSVVHQAKRSPSFSVSQPVRQSPPPNYRQHPMQQPLQPPFSLTSPQHCKYVNDHFGEMKLKTDVNNSFCNVNEKYSTKYNWTEKSLITILTSEIEELCYTNEYEQQQQQQQFSITSSSSSSSSFSLHVKQNSSTKSEYHSFFSQSKQPFNLEFYINRLVTYSNCSSSAFIIMLAYIDRIQERCKYLLINEMNCHRIILTCLILAIKFIDDEVFSNTHYARVGGVEPHEMNQLENKLLQILNWELYVSPEMFKFYENGLIHKLQSSNTNDITTNSNHKDHLQNQLFSNICTPATSPVSPAL